VLRAELRVASIPERQFSIASLYQFHTMMSNVCTPQVHIVYTIESLMNDIYTVHSIWFSAHDLNHPAEDTLVSSCTSIINWKFHVDKISLLKNFNYVNLIQPTLHGNDHPESIFNDYLIECSNSCSTLLLGFIQASWKWIFSTSLRSVGCWNCGRIWWFWNERFCALWNEPQ